MKTYWPKALIAALPLAGLLANTPAVFAHGDENRGHGRFHQGLKEEHREAHRDLNAAHREFHQYPSSGRQHRHFHRDLAREHRAVHRDLWGWRRGYHNRDRDRSWYWR